jgi:hypothetical protein
MTCVDDLALLFGNAVFHFKATTHNMTLCPSDLFLPHFRTRQDIPVFFKKNSN